MEARRAHAVHEHVVRCVQVEAFFDFGVGRDPDMCPCRGYNGEVQEDAHGFK